VAKIERCDGGELFPSSHRHVDGVCVGFGRLIVPYDIIILYDSFSHFVFPDILLARGFSGV